jgi:hypothetical protein
VVPEAVRDGRVAREAPAAVEGELRVLPLARPGLTAVGRVSDPEPVAGVVVRGRDGVHRIHETLRDGRLVLRERRIAVAVHLDVVEGRGAEQLRAGATRRGDLDLAPGLRGALTDAVRQPAVPVLDVLHPSRNLVCLDRLTRAQNDREAGQ